MGGKKSCRGMALAAVAAAAFMLADEAFAVSTTTPLSLSVKIAPGCTISVTDMNFGTRTTVVGTETATSNVTVVCSGATLVYLSFTPVFSVAGTTKSSALTNPAGDKINFTMTQSGYVGFGSNLIGTLTGKLAATPNPPPGIYKSVETIYINY